jgi:hypothetical protein
MADRPYSALAALVAALGATLTPSGAIAQQAIGSATSAQNQVTRELSGAAAPLSVGDSVFRNEVVRTGSDSLAKLVFLDSTNLAVGPTSRIVLDRFVYEGDPGAEKVAVGLAKGLFRFTTGTLDKKAYTITTPTAAIGVRGTVLDIDVRNETRVTLVEGRALVCPKRNGVSFEQQARNCGKSFGGGAIERTGGCDCAQLDHPGQTATAKKVGGTATASLTNNPVNFSSLCSGDASLCSGATYASSGINGASGGGGGGALCGR